MIKVENIVVSGWEAAIRGMRNSHNSWDKSDSGICKGGDEGIGCYICAHQGECGHDFDGSFQVGREDKSLMLSLAHAGSSHAKYRRFITVTMDITAPLYWWKEFDTYKVGTVANSTSTMHSISKKEFTLADFSCEHLEGALRYEDEPGKTYAYYNTPLWILQVTIEKLNEWRELYINGGVHLWDGEEREFKPKEKDIWWQMIQLLPSSYNQKRTVFVNYENLSAMYHQRHDHRLDEWHGFCDVIERLPHSELITVGD